MKIKKLFVLLLLFFSCCLYANDNVVNVYNWSEFMPASVLRAFEKETGIHVNYSEFDSNSTLYAKLKTNPKIGFDIVVPTSNYVERMKNEDMLSPIDKTQLTNLKNINPGLLNQNFDPHNTYSIPYFWGTTGIVVNDRYYDPKDFQYWKDLWKSTLINKLLILDDSKEAFSMALITLGYSPNSKNPQEIFEAYRLLKKLYKNIKLFNADAIANLYVDEDAEIGMGWSGDIYLAMEENSHIHYIYPKPYFSIWMDCMAIPKYAPHYHNALLFINYILRSDVAKKIAEHVGYSTPNNAAMQLLPEKMKNNPTFNPSSSTLKKGIVQSDTGDADRLYEKYWQLLKLGGN